MTKSHVKLKKVGLYGQISLMQIKLHWQYNVNFLISKYLSCNRKTMLAINGKKA